MYIAILSDIHANFQALSAVLQDIETFKVDEIISLGDNIGYGPQPEEVVTMLRQKSILSIMGNHELALADPAYFDFLNPDPQKTLDIHREMLSHESLHYCTTLPHLLLRHKARFIHGCPPRSVTAYLFQPPMERMRRIFAGYSEQFCFFGHLHTLDRYVLAADRCRYEEAKIGVLHCETESRYLLNVGSVGQPRDGINRKAKYALWHTEKNSFELREVAYDSKRTKQLLKEYGFPEMNGARL